MSWGMSEFEDEPKQALVILATPEFSSWFEDTSFIAKFLKKVARISPRYKYEEDPKTSDEPVEPFEMDVVCACVDGLSPQADWSPNITRRSTKHGFSIFYGRASKILPNLWDVEDSTTVNSPSMTATLTFAKGGPAPNQSHVVLPLANTLFSNGRHSTLLISKWQLEKGSFVKVRAEERMNQIINVFNGQALGPLSIHVPATPLTPARRIISGLGNIVRQIDFGEGDAGGASRELEANIDEYLLQTKREKATIAVWALIIPKDAILLPKSKQKYALLYEPDRIKSLWEQTSPNPNFIGYWIKRGAKFCRVLSGGGGWGVKQGLLSLDPQSTYSEVSEARFDFSTGSLEEQQTSALGNIAEPDAYIQFFVLDNNSPRQMPTRNPNPRRDGIRQMSTVIGTIPSSIDDQRPDDYAPGTVGDTQLDCERGHFGAVSEAGIFLSAPSMEKTTPTGGDSIIRRRAIQTKIDLPYSYVYRNFAPVTKPGKLNATERLLAKGRRLTSRELGLNFRKVKKIFWSNQLR